MPRFQNTLVGRLAIPQFAIHLVLPPILYYRLDAMITKSAGRTFTRHAHAYASALAHELELAATPFTVAARMRCGNCSRKE